MNLRPSPLLHIRTRILAVAMLCIVGGAARAQFAQGVSGQNTVFAVPAVALGERGRFSLTIGGAFTTQSGHGNWTFASIGVNPLRTVHLQVGAGVDARGASAPIHEQMFFGLRWILFDYVARDLWNVGMDLEAMRDRPVRNGAGVATVTRARILADLHPLSSLALTSFVGSAGSATDIGGMFSHTARLIWGGGAIYQLATPISVMGECSNAVYPTDPATTVVLGGIRLFPSPVFSLTLGAGSALRAGQQSEPVVQLQLGYSVGAMTTKRGDDNFNVITAPVSAQSPPAPSTGIAAPVSISDFTPDVQSDMHITSVVAIGRPGTGGSILSSIDSELVANEWRWLSTTSDSAVRMQVTGMENLATLDDNAGSIARMELLHAAVAFGVDPERVILRDQFLARSGQQRSEFGLFRTTERLMAFTRIARVPATSVATVLDSLSMLLSASSMYTRARIVVECDDINALELRAAYALQNMMYRQALFASYNVDITFRRPRNPAVDGHRSMIILEVGQ
jgi:hypothetical protein